MLAREAPLNESGGAGRRFCGAGIRFLPASRLRVTVDRVTFRHDLLEHVPSGPITERSSAQTPNRMCAAVTSIFSLTAPVRRRKATCRPSARREGKGRSYFVLNFLDGTGAVGAYAEITAPFFTNCVIVSERASCLGACREVRSFG